MPPTVMLVSIVAFWVLEEEKRAVSEAVGTAPVDQLEEADQLLVEVATQVIVAACAFPAMPKKSVIVKTHANEASRRLELATLSLNLMFGVFMHGGSDTGRGREQNLSFIVTCGHSGWEGAHGDSGLSNFAEGDLCLAANANSPAFSSRVLVVR
jgi:hypothetical protein